MPFRSQAQRKFMYAAETRGDVPKGTADRWQDETPKGKSLPERLSKKAAVPLPAHLVEELATSPEFGQGYQIADLYLADGRILYSVPIMNGETAVVDEDIPPEDIEHIEKVGVAKRAKLKKSADMIKWTAFVDESYRISEGGPGDSESSSKTQFPYAPAANRASS